MLSEPDVIEALNRDYVSTWVLFQDLIKILGIKVDEEPGQKYIDAVKAEAAKRISVGTDFERLCARLLAGYHYPVDTHVFRHDGTYVGNTSADELFSNPQIWNKFLDLLKKGAGR